MHITSEKLTGLLFDALRRMDEEATSLTKTGQPTGLSDYGRHARKDLSKPQAEVVWSRRLAQLIAPHVTQVRTEVRYPDYAVPDARKRQRCDLVVQLDSRQSIWIEVKGAWRDYWGGDNRIYRCYLLHPLVSDADAGKTHTVPFDFAKLAALHAPEADHVAELLIGFENPEDSMLDDVATLVELAHLSEWSGSETSWMSPSVPNQRVRGWFWHRPVTGKI
ncbi:MAG: hypothetical protein ABIK28_01555 [Planctomycetota bacterium]